MRRREQLAADCLGRRLAELTACGQSGRGDKALRRYQSASGGDRSGRGCRELFRERKVGYRVHQLCDRPRSCENPPLRPLVDCPEIRARREINEECLKARKDTSRECFSGAPDPGDHPGAILDVIADRDLCAVLASACP